MATGFTSNNPTLSREIFNRARAEGGTSYSDFSTRSFANSMTLEGTVVKTGILVAILCATGLFSWTRAMAEIGGAGHGISVTPMAGSLAMLGVIGGLIFAMITSFSPRSAPITAPLYAAAEGLALGAISAVFENAYGGIVLNAVGLTIGALVMLLGMYSTGMVRATPMFTRIVVTATGAICMVYLANLVLSLFGIHLNLLHSGTPIGLAISLVVVVVAALNLVLDFDLIEQGTRQGAPKFMEWYGGFALLVTLVWLYMELLRLLAALRQRD